MSGAHQNQQERDSASPTLADQAYRLLEDEIVRLQLPPGALVTEQQLASRFALGRTPVREAALRLVSDRLLTIFPRKGLMIATINPLDVLLALDVRAALERLVASAAAVHADAEERVAIQACSQAMGAAAEAGDADRFMQQDKKFDRLLAATARNPFAAQALLPLQIMSRRAWYFFLRNDDLSPAAALHVAVMQAVTAGDATAAAQASDILIAHIRDGIKMAVARM
ncbi:GntR family transcriptional regulator [Methylovirgula sp. 4M-Z18]|uniref:GntR family transcriptional regulator n=1 Tax=Methylovirgula sp. 4M-Z18 TaxID=2293567 RepID=UPI000E2FBBC0|nr:GntR family transcriptional regulator [Methylovirgula sp. 4M-Z18]RFB80138.1 GntR family transcriptional regulator [Methylovirgula sp. 4M-Z18]